MFCGTFFELGGDLVPDANSADFNSDFEGDRINLSGYDRALYVIMKPAGSAGDDLSLAFQQHTAASGGSSKALTFRRWWYKRGTLSSVGQWTPVVESTPPSDLDTQTPTDYEFDTVAAMIVVEIMAEDRDVNNGYKFVSFVNEGDDLGNAMLATSFWLLQGSRYMNAIPPNPLT
jgi:hypothetical protein